MFRVLFMCTGNRCRSPFAAASFAKLAEGLPVEVESVGTADLGPVPPTTDAIRVAATHGVDVTAHAARSLDKVDASSFDAVIGFERNHLAAAVVDGGVPYERAFLLPELDRLLSAVATPAGGDPVERARAALHEASQARAGFVPGEEVDDPIGRPVGKYQEVFSQIHDLNTRVVEGLFAGADRAAQPVPAAATVPLGDASAARPPSERLLEDRIWGTDSGTAAPDEVVPEAEAEPMATESPIPEATST